MASVRLARLRRAMDEMRDLAMKYPWYKECDHEAASQLREARAKLATVEGGGIWVPKQ
jgi:hypothetical protein